MTMRRGPIHQSAQVTQYQHLFPFEIRHLGERYREVGLSHLNLDLYALRHGGAWHDALTARRKMTDIRRRGGWQSERSTKRYEKRVRALQEISRIEPSMQQYGKHILDNLHKYMHNPRTDPKPPINICR